MSDLSEAKSRDSVLEPDPRFEEHPHPTTRAAAVGRIVRFVLMAIADAGGPALVPNVNMAEAVFDEHWGKHVEAHLKNHPDAWGREWRHVVHVAKKHGIQAVMLAHENSNRGPVSADEFKSAGEAAAGYCRSRFPRVQTLGCWCNIC